MADNSSLHWLQGESEYTQALAGTLFTWFMTALGAGMIFILPLKSKNTKTLLDCSLGFAAGVMLAASYWSLLAPALEKAESTYGVHRYAPVAFGFLLGAAFVAYAGSMSFIEHAVQKHTKSFELEMSMEKSDSVEAQALNEKTKKELENKQNSFRRMIALVIAITVHNIPEGLAVGVGFGGADFAQARNLAIGIGIQNFPEGLAVSLPLAASGETLGKSFFWGQLSGLVEPIFGMLGVFTVSISSVLLPYALGFAAGAMIYVVMDDIVPDACSRDNASLAAKFSMIGFVVMMTLDVALG